MDQPWLSVIIPTYNGEDYLQLALDSILLQYDDLKDSHDHNHNIECIAIDDGSTDRTISILKSYADKLPIKIIQAERKGNWVATTNHALSIAKGKYVCFLHQDDLWLKDRLYHIKKLIDQHPEINLLLHPACFIDRNGKKLGDWQCPLPVYPQIVPSTLIMERLLVQNFIAIPAPIFKREVALQAGGLDEKLWYTADWDFWLKISSLGSTIYYPRLLSAFRVHPNSQTIVRSSYVSEFQEQMEIVLDRYLGKWQGSTSRKISIEKIAKFSIQVNTALASLVHNQKVNLWQIFSSFLSLGIWSWHQYFRDSRLSERVWARLKIKFIK